MAKSVEFWFDFGSPACLPGVDPTACHERRHRRHRPLYRPMLLGGVFQATGNHSPTSVPAKGSYTFTTWRALRAAMACR
jgi:2-hydroxychromene-2-carboxylate isomerase